LPEKTYTIALPEQRVDKRMRWLVLLWLVAAISVGGMAYSTPAGWDTEVYWQAIQSVGRGGSPYADGIAAQRKFYSHIPSHTVVSGPTPMTFVYSPLTLPFLRVLSWFPGWLLGPLYTSGVIAGFLLQLWAGYHMATEKERRWLAYLLPFAVFFPGLLSSDVLLSGNVAYILYGLVLAAAVPGWKRDKWLWFYLAVLVASVCKAPLLTLIAFPVLVGKRQWRSAILTGTVGSLLFAAQPLLWPEQFREYLIAVRLQFDWNEDFGSSPAGVLGRWLWRLNKPYSPATTIAYLAWAIILGALLLAFRSRLRRQSHLRKMWIPIALAGTILMNPRIKPYDNAALTIPSLLICWRVLLVFQKLVARWRAGLVPGVVHLYQAPRKNRRNLAPVLAGVGCFAACNITDVWGNFGPMELLVSLLVFALGIWSLWMAGDSFAMDPLRPEHSPSVWSDSLPVGRRSTY
jgi:hypothetical protein